MEKEETVGNVIKVGRKSNKVVVFVLTFGKEVKQMLCAYGPQSGRLDAKQVYFSEEIVSEWDLGSSCKIIFSSRNFNGPTGKYNKGFAWGNGIEMRNVERRRLL